MMVLASAATADGALDSTELLFLLGVVLAPLVVVMVVALLRGYHVNLSIWRHRHPDEPAEKKKGRRS